MKKTVSALLVTLLSFSAFAAGKIQTSQDKGLSILDYVYGVKTVFSAKSNIQAKVIEVLAGDGMNASRMILVLNDVMSADNTPKIYELDIMMVGVLKLSFTAKDTLTINYSQDDIDPKTGNQFVAKRKAVVKILRDQSGALTNEISLQ